MESRNNYLRVDNERGLFKIPRRAYTDREIGLRERQKIFSKCWVYVGHDSELVGPGAFVSREVVGQDLIFNRDGSGKVRAFFNVCPHRGSRVCREKKGTARSFQCFYHGWVFSAEGPIRHLPNENLYSSAFKANVPGLQEVPRLEQYAGFWFANFDGNAVPLPEYLAGAKEYLDTIADQSATKMVVLPGAQEYSIRSNWKMLMENSADQFHFATTHATYTDFVKDRIEFVKTQEPDAFFAENLTQASVGGRRARDLGNGHAVTEYSAPWGRPMAQWHPTWGKEGKEEVDRTFATLERRVGAERAQRLAHRNRNLMVFPNLVLIDGVAVTIRTFFADNGSPDHMKVQSWALGPEEESPWLRRMRLENYIEFLGPGGFGTPDDVEAMEACQRGYRATEDGWNDISGGMREQGEDREVIDGEITLRAFWSEWDRRMTETARAAA